VYHARTRHSQTHGRAARHVARGARCVSESRMFAPISARHKAGHVQLRIAFLEAHVLIYIIVPFIYIKNFIYAYFNFKYIVIIIIVKMYIEL
jgi:hypothetical protein